MVPFIINITMEINFSSKIYSKSLLKGSPLYPPYGTMQVKRGERWSTVGYTIHLEINFSSKVHSKNLLKVELLKGSSRLVPYI